MKFFIVLSCIFGFEHSAFAMPCDAGYNCFSKTGKYKISLQRCRYRNHLSLLTTKINHLEIMGASLNKGWDGDSLLAFEINIPTADTSSVRILSAEFSAKHKIGILKEKFAASEPGPLQTVRSEKLYCLEVE